VWTRTEILECDFLGQACGSEVEKMAALHFSSIVDCHSLKNVGERIARYQNHVTFLLKCRQKGVIPKGLVLLLLVNSAKGRLIADRASQAYYEKGSDVWDLWRWGWRKKSEQPSRRGEVSIDTTVDWWGGTEDIWDYQGKTEGETQATTVEEEVSQGVNGLGETVVNLSRRPLSDTEMTPV